MVVDSHSLLCAVFLRPQPELRAHYKTLFQKTTRSNNATWMRRKLLEAAKAGPVPRENPVDDEAAHEHEPDAPDSGVRKSKRPVKPRILDLLPSGAMQLAPGAVRAVDHAGLAPARISGPCRPYRNRTLARTACTDRGLRNERCANERRRLSAGG
jgi:hypothetical protein